MKQDKITAKEKKYRKAEKELNKIWQKLRNKPFRKLDKPVQLGWILSLKLREDFARSSEGSIVQDIIKTYGKKTAIYNPKWVAAIRRHPQHRKVESFMLQNTKSYFGTFTSYHDLPHVFPYVRSLTPKEYENYLPPNYKKYFYPEWVSRRGDRYLRYVFLLPEHYLLVKVDKRMVTHIQDIDPELLSREAELKAFLEPYWQSHRYSDIMYPYQEKAKRRETKVKLRKAMTVDVDEFYRY